MYCCTLHRRIGTIFFCVCQNHELKFTMVKRVSFFIFYFNFVVVRKQQQRRRSSMNMYFRWDKTTERKKFVHTTQMNLIKVYTGESIIKFWLNAAVSAEKNQFPIEKIPNYSAEIVRVRSVEVATIPRKVNSPILRSINWIYRDL